MKIELDEIETAHISSLINERKNTIEKILNAVENDDDAYLKNYYENEKKIMNEINRKLFGKE